MRDCLLVKKLLLIGIILFSFNMYGQIGIGTPFADPASDLTLGSEDKGMLLNNVALVSLNSPAPLKTRDMIPGIMVYNRTVNGELEEGIYYWTAENKWSKLYVKTSKTRDMQFVKFIETKSKIDVTATPKEVSDLNFDYNAELNGLLFLDYVLYATISTGKEKASNLFCFTTVTDDTGKEVYKGMTTISPYIIVDNQGYNCSFGMSNFAVPVQAGRTYKVRLAAQETYATKFAITIGDFNYKQTVHSSLKITFISEASY